MCTSATFLENSANANACASVSACYSSVIRPSLELLWLCRSVGVCLCLLVDLVVSDSLFVCCLFVCLSLSARYYFAVLLYETGAKTDTQRP